MELGYIILNDNPIEWKHTELAAELVQLIRPDEKAFGMLPVWAADVFRAVDMDRWYLLRNEDRDRAVRNGQGNQIETFITRLGVPFPHRGALRLYSMYREDVIERGNVRGEYKQFQRTITKMRKRGKHEPISIDQAYTYWEAQRRKLGVSQRKAVRLLGPMPQYHIIDGWPVGMKEKIRNAEYTQIHI